MFQQSDEEFAPTTTKKAPAAAPKPAAEIRKPKSPTPEKIAPSPSFAPSPDIIEATDDDSYSKDAAPVVTKKLPEKAPLAEKKTVAINDKNQGEKKAKEVKKRKKLDSDQSDDDYVKEIKPKASQKAKKVVDSDEESVKATKKRTTSKKQKKLLSDSEDDFMPEVK